MAAARRALLLALAAFPATAGRPSDCGALLESLAGLRQAEQQRLCAESFHASACKKALGFLQLQGESWEAEHVEEACRKLQAAVREPEADKDSAEPSERAVEQQGPRGGSGKALLLGEVGRRVAASAEADEDLPGMHRYRRRLLTAAEALAHATAVPGHAADDDDDDDSDDDAPSVPCTRKRSSKATPDHYPGLEAAEVAWQVAEEKQLDAEQAELEAQELEQEAKEAQLALNELQVRSHERDAALAAALQGRPIRPCTDAEEEAFRAARAARH